MIIRLAFLVAASVAAYVVKNNGASNSKKPDSLVRHPEQCEPILEDHQDEEESREDADNNVSPENDTGPSEEEEKEEEEGEEEVKRISSIINPATSSTLSLDDEELLPEFEDLFSGEIEFPLPNDKFDVKSEAQAEKERLYEAEMAKNASELERLRNLVREMEEREVKLEGELLEYYGMQEQESDIAELQKQLKMKTVEMNMLNVSINTLQAERKKLQEEIAEGATAKKELEIARNKIKELQRQIQLEANQTKGQLLLLKQQVTSLQSKEGEAVKKDSEIEKKLQSLKELEVEVMELKRKNKELQYEKRELTIKLDTSEARVAALSNMTESDMVAGAREEVNKLRHANEDLAKQVEGLQMNRFSEVEELVYLRWVNACLRFELRNYQTPAGKTSARDLSKSLSPRSQEKAKQLMLEYAGSERGQGDTDVESISSLPSSPGSEDFDSVSIDSSTSRVSNFSKKAGLIMKLKKWGKSKDDSSALSSPSRSFGGNSPSRPSMSQRSSAPRGPLESLMIRNASDSVAITTFGKEQDTIDSPETPNLPRITTRVASSDSLNNVASSFQLMSKSVEGVMDEKYPAYKDRHKLALEREKAIKVKADQARAERFGGFSNSSSSFESRAKVPVMLPPKLTQLKERASVPNDSSEQSNGSNKGNSEVVSKMKLEDIAKRAPRVPRPPPRSSSSKTPGAATTAGTGVPPAPPRPPMPPGAPPPPPRPGGPPLPPPPPGSLSKGPAGDKVHRAPEVVEFYQTLMKREAKKDINPALITTTSNVSDARSNMLGEIANKSTFLLAVKADVETQGDFVQSLAAEVRAASFDDVEDLVSFVQWLDEELSFLVDERAVLKHFDWPEGKADAMREAAFEYQDLMKLEKRVTSFVDDPALPCEAALKKMYSLLEKVEQSVYALLRTRDMAISRYREFGIPTNWLQDSGVVGKIKLSSVQLARKYMMRVASELDAMSGTEKEPNREFLLLQGVRFAFRVHQFAGGFDAESMRYFEELRSRANASASASASAQSGEADKKET